MTGVDPGEAWRRRLGELLGPRARTDLTTRAAYSGDASLYRRVPAAVVEPRDAEDVAVALAHAVAAGVPVTARGGGTSVAGNAVGDGLVLDFSRRMHAVLDVDPEARTATVQPGLVLDALQAAAAPHGLTFGPDPSTHSRCTVGGMIGNNACGPHSVAWGTTADSTVSLSQLTAAGERLVSTAGSSGSPRIDAELVRLRSRHRAALRAELGRFSRQVSGYALAHLLPEHSFDVAKALVGSEATCAILVEATVRLTPAPAARALAVLGFADVQAAADAAPALAALGALTVEGMDSELLDALRARGGRASAVELLPAGAAWLYCETGGGTSAEARAAALRVVRVAPGRTGVVVADPLAQRALWRVREDGAGIVTRLPDGGEAWPGWEDSAVPPERLGSYLRDLRRLLAEHGLRGIPYGHFGEGCLHLRTDWRLGTPVGVAGYRRFVEQAADLVASHGGSISGEHGDGRARSELLGRMYSPEILAAFAEFKAVFDPGGHLNPGVLVEPEPFDTGLRPGQGNDRVASATLPVHALHADGGDLGAAVRRCVGVGRCRQAEAGTMCPSYKVTRDEVHSTRGRARVLSEMLRGEALPGGWRSEQVREALDLCLSCKACRNDCPVNVDMATYKAEFLFHHYRGRLRPRAHYALGWLPLLARLAAPLPGVANALAGTAALTRLAGLERRRELPRFAARPLPRQVRTLGGRPRLLLWPDTFTAFFAPEVGLAAVRVLRALGYDVAFPAAPVCCGLTWHSTGQLGMARRAARRTVRVLEPELRAGTAIVGLEPSCTSMLRVETAELLGDDERARLFAAAVRPLAQVVAEHEGPWPFRRLDARAVVQPHCHQQATVGFGADAAVLGRLGVTADLVTSGCCGLAGNFGFERGHWEVAQGAAALQLYPKVSAAADTDLVLADGFSCRLQIAQGTRRHGLHLAQVLAAALDGRAPSTALTGPRRTGGSG